MGIVQSYDAFGGDTLFRANCDVCAAIGADIHVRLSQHKAAANEHSRAADKFVEQLRNQIRHDGGYCSDDGQMILCPNCAQDAFTSYVSRQRAPMYPRSPSLQGPPIPDSALAFSTAMARVGYNGPHVDPTQQYWPDVNALWEDTPGTPAPPVPPLTPKEVLRRVKRCS